MTYVRSTRLSGNLILSGNLSSETDNTTYLGSPTKELLNLYLDGVAYIDTLYTHDTLISEGAIASKKFVSKSAAYTMTLSDCVVLVDTSTAFTITLPAVATADGIIYIFKKTDSAGNALTIDGNASETIDGATTNTEIDAQYDMLVLICLNSAWHIIGRKIAA